MPNNYDDYDAAGETDTLRTEWTNLLPHISKLSQAEQIYELRVGRSGLKDMLQV